VVLGTYRPKLSVCTFLFCYPCSSQTFPHRRPRPFYSIPLHLAPLSEPARPSSSPRTERSFDWFVLGSSRPPLPPDFSGIHRHPSRICRRPFYPMEPVPESFPESRTFVTFSALALSFHYRGSVHRVTHVPRVSSCDHRTICFYVSYSNQK
jgi:hypothetical protein